jgi:hypothetical protein
MRPNIRYDEYYTKFCGPFWQYIVGIRQIVCSSEPARRLPVPASRDASSEAAMPAIGLGRRGCSTNISYY